MKALWIASGASDNNIVLMDRFTKTMMWKVEAHTGGICGLQFLSEGILSTGNDGIAKLWDIK